MIGGPYIVASTPEYAYMLLEEQLAEAQAISSGAADWDQLNAVQGIAIALQALDDLKRMVRERDEELERFRSRWGQP